MISVALPFPEPELNPNHCCHWSKKATLKAVARESGKYAVLKHSLVFTKKDLLHLSIVFFPPKRRKLDLDNSLASCKALIDGVADGLRINDRQIKRITVEQAAHDGNPRVVMTLARIDGGEDR